MNKITKLFAILALVASTTLWSCKGDTGDVGPKGEKGDTGATGATGANGPKGDTGATGPAGAKGEKGDNGMNGNANVESYTFTVGMADWKQTDVAGVGTGATSPWGVAAYMNEKITTEKFVMVYVVTNDQKRKALPTIYNIGMSGSLEHMDFEYETGKLYLMYRLQTQMFGGTTTFAPNSDLKFEVVLTTKTVMTGMKSSGVDLNNYDDVMSFISAQ